MFAAVPFIASALHRSAFPRLKTSADKISAMIEKYRRETIDIEDVEFEEVDLELETLFPDPNRKQDIGDRK